MKKLIVSIVIATSSCFAMLSPASAAIHKVETHSSQVQHQKQKVKAKHVVASKHKVTKHQSKPKAVKKVVFIQNKNVHAKAKLVPTKHFIAQKKISRR